MRRLSYVLSLAAALMLLVVVPTAAQEPPGQEGGGPEPGNQPFDPRLYVLGFDTLGVPSTGYNSAMALDAARNFTYVGSIELGPLFGQELEGDPAVKAVDVANPSRPAMTDAEPPLGGDLGTWDVSVAGNILAASTQGFPGTNAGVTLMDITDPAHPQAVRHIGEAELQSPFGSHTNFLWRDPATNQTWLFITGLDTSAMQLYLVTDPRNPVKVAEYVNPGGPFGDGYVHESYVQENGGRVLSYQVGTIGFEVVDVTRIVRGGQAGPITHADVVGFNYYTAELFGIELDPPAPVESPTVTRPDFAHYPEPTASGRVTWVGDEAACGQPAIVHAFDTSGLPLPPAKKPLPEIGVIIENPDPIMCAGLINRSERSRGRLPQLNDFRWTGHNFDIVGENLMIRADYGRGVEVYDISDPATAGWVSRTWALDMMVGDENKTEPGRDHEAESYPNVWEALYDPDGSFIYASDINQGFYALDLCERVRGAPQCPVPPTQRAGR
jgi:hypothetical protein